ncbi:MAG TPA: exodeoxyribonuclease VII large subunit, partial [Acidimicrobiia bacterium]
MDEQPTFTVTEINTVIRDALRAAIPREVWVQGEVQGLKTSGLGHSYFQLVEKVGRGERVLSRLDVALFRGERPAVNAALRDAGLKLADDIGVRIRGRVDFYPPNGRLQLVMTGIDPVFTVGGMAANRERLLKALAAEGLLRANAALPMPAVPLRVGLVTSHDSAAYHDFVHELEVSRYAWQVCLADVRVQGSGAPKRLVWALRALARQRVDVVVIVRGGGSRSDLAPFDAEAVARTIAEMPVPVLTGIGHEVDRSVADEVAHTACKTPTACAQELVEQVGAFVDRLDDVSR